MASLSSESLTTDSRVKAIMIYPIKSCKGMSVSEAPLSPTGFLWDRHWAVVNSNNGRACTQRVEPRLALIHVHLPPLAFSSSPPPPCSCLDSETRPVDPLYATGFNVKFTDAFQFLLISQASLDTVNEQLKEPVSINRFRPNILVDGCESFAEDLWKQIRINQSNFHGVMLCPRCKVPTINQEDATEGSEPTATMMKFRSAKALEVNTTTTKYKGRVYLGQMLVCEDNDSSFRKIISVGDIVHVEQVFSSYADVAV
uniref:mitochondrial amidoxime-reducing component 1-like isoform X2 n=1 Tax=Erigeron canadensis TaxID=72917 RepID=UPI001CB99966|nr:mitochondrial amidoxime-reducing component 1-like isoform X2 [Erigeron canadensis]